MVTVPGTINIRSVPGRFGTFNVGTLDCDLGSFAVKDASIEEFEPGVYHGDFVIEKIKPTSYLSGGRLVVEVRATLRDILLADGCEPEPPIFEGLEQDPIEEDFTVHSGGPLDDTYPSVSLDMDGDQEDHEAISLFGHLWPLGRVVKLDATIPRSALRQQKNYLLSKGYTFVSSRQHWVMGN